MNLAAYLAAMGKYVLLVDLDSQANATMGLGTHMAENGPNIYHSLVSDLNPQLSIKKTSMFGFDILPAAQSLAGATVELVSMEERELRLKKVLDPIRTNYDYILVDCPPSLGLLTINALASCEQVIIPVQCEYYALEGLSQLLKTVELIRQGLNPDLQVMGVLLTMHDRRNHLSNQVVNEIYKNFPGRVFNAVIPRVVSLAEAPSFGKTILQFDPNSKAANEYRRLADEVIKLTTNY